jgi:spermidine synthase
VPAAGDVAAAGTVGSLLGTFLATHWLVPSLGCRLALVVAAVALLVAAVVIAGQKARRGALVALALVGATSTLHGGPLKAPPAGVELLAERETPYQFLQVHRRATDGVTRTTLVINEGLDSFHSLALDDSAFTAGAYYDWHAVAPLLAGAGRPGAKLRALSIGDAAGTLRRIYAALFPSIEVDAVDIDAETMALGDDYFAAEKASGQRYAMDGRQFLAHAEARWDVIHVDAYAHQVYVPAHLASREFFTAAKARLTEGGVLACNVGALRLDDAVLRAVVGTIESVFEEVQVLLIPNSRNALVLARRSGELSPASLSEHVAIGELSANDRARWRGLLEHASDERRWRTLTDAGPVLVDDQPLLDELLLQSYVAGSEDPAERLEPNGELSLAAAEQAAYEANQRGDHERALDALSSSAADSAFLRLQAGDARWYRRQLKSAALEYEAALALSGAGDVSETLRARLRALQAELAPVARAHSAATRSTWLSVLAAAVAAGVAVFICRL